MTTTITVADEDYNLILEALSYASEDYAYRADYEDKTNGDDRHEFQAAADQYSEVYARLTGATTDAESCLQCASRPVEPGSEWCTPCTMAELA